MMAPPPMSVGQPQMSTARSRSRLLMTGLAGVALVVLMFAGGGGGGGKSVDSGAAAPEAALAAAGGAPLSSSDAAAPSPRVPVTIYVMSRCPDAQYCEVFLEPILKPLKRNVRLRAEYIVREVEGEGDEAASGNNGDGGDGGEEKQNTKTTTLACPHGKQECDGNKQQLCLQKRLDDRIAAGKLSADATVDVLLKFLTCGWRRPSEIGSESGARACLAEVGWSSPEEQEGVLACARGDEGEALLRASHAATRAAGATNSCTMEVAGRRRCVRDGGAFRECEEGSAASDFTRTICAALVKMGGAAAAVCK